MQMKMIYENDLTYLSVPCKPEPSLLSPLPEELVVYRYSPSVARQRPRSVSVRQHQNNKTKKNTPPRTPQEIYTWKYRPRNGGIAR